MKMTTDTWHSESRQFLSLADLAQLKGGVLRRSVILALIIGSALTWFNQFDALFGSETLQILPLFLVYVTPFIVVAISQLTATRQAWLDAKEGRIPGTTENLVATALSHGIPARTVTIGLILGTINSAIILSEAYLNTGYIGAASATLLGQAYTLPVLFGFLSQAVSYRRAIKTFVD